MENKNPVPKHGSLSSYSVLSAATHPSVRNKNDLLQRIRSGNDVLCRIPDRLDPNIQFSDDDEDEDIPQNEENKSPLKELAAKAIVDKTPELKLKKSHSSLPSYGSTTKASLFDPQPFSSTKPPMGDSHFRKASVPQSEQSVRTKKPLHEIVGKTPDLHAKKSHHTLPAQGYSPRVSSFDRQHFSASKPPSSSHYGKLPHPQSEQRVRTKEPLNNKPVSAQRSSKNLMSQPEFKVPRPLHDTILVNGKPYSVLSLLGTGGSCKVFSCYESSNDLVAVKCVDLAGTDPLIRAGYEREIEYLKKLQGSDRVIKMIDYEYRQNELLLVLERGEIDFGRYISNEAKLKSLNPLTVRFFWSQMLEAVSHIHCHNIVHSDLKPANFLLVSGRLKLIDFGIATHIPSDKTSALRDTQVGTLNYMSPEAVTQLSSEEDSSATPRFKVGVKSDVWSLGCILYNLVYGHTPFQQIRTLIGKIRAITDPRHEIPFPPLPTHSIHLVDVLKKCLKRDPGKRASVDELLHHPYLNDLHDTTQSRDEVSSNLMAQLQVLTPRRMSTLAKMVNQLSGNNSN